MASLEGCANALSAHWIAVRLCHMCPLVTVVDPVLMARITNTKPSAGRGARGDHYPPSVAVRLPFSAALVIGA